jgi:NAD(P)-dependent dehydrogenase (short-subunit alcohol dehydrogenase family)
VNSVAPGWIYENVQKAYFDWLAAERGVTHQDVYDEIAAASDLKRLPLPKEVAQAVVFLASDRASAITGHCLDINCGEYHS